MRGLDFMRMVWATQGFYLIATPKSYIGDDGNPGTYWVHKPFDTVDEAVSYAHSHGHTDNQYFACLSTKARFIIDEKKKAKAEANGWKNATGRVYRSKINMGWARSYFLDLDVGVGKSYASQELAIGALDEFVTRLRLPWPWLVSSGYGVHVYWPLDEDVAAEDWQPHAAKLKRICAHFELAADPARTSDVSSVLRVPGTKNLKNAADPRDVRVMRDGDEPCSFSAFTSALDTAGRMLPTGEFAQGEIPASLKESTEPPRMNAVAAACAQVNHLILHQAEQSQTAWYWLLGVARFCVNPREVAHAVSRFYPGYNPDEVDAKLEQLAGTTADGRSIGPSTCGRIRDECGAERCNACWFKKQTAGWEKSSPIVAARRLPKVAPSETIPNPPAPFARVTNGVMRNAEPPHMILPYDFFPVLMIDDPRNKRKLSQWEAILPRRGSITVMVPTEELNDLRLLRNLLGNHGLVTQSDEVKWVQQYMSAYIRELQKHQDEQHQHAHLGWTDDRDTFVLPHGEIKSGKTKPTLLTSQARSATEAVHRAGTLERAKELMQFYNRADYRAHQFQIAASLAAPLFYMTGHFGAVVNMVGASGCSKSTALYTGASLWGDPDDYTLQGTASGGSAKGKANRVQMLSNLPFCVDELTLMAREDAKDLILGFSQKGNKVILDQNSNERKQVGTTKSTLMLCNSNTSLHELLSLNNQSGTASSMRLFEIPTLQIHDPDLPEHEAKKRADDYLADVRKNYGWIGPAFVEHVTANIETIYKGVRDEQSRFDKLVEAKQHERFWSAVAATTIYAMKLAQRLGLLPYDAHAIERWLIETQMERMRSVVKQNYMGAVDQLLAYLAASSGNIMILASTSGVPNTKELHRGELAGHLDITTGKCVVVLSHFRTYCLTHRVQLDGLVAELTTKGVVKRIKSTPASGTIHAKGQMWCLEIDMKHHLVTGSEAIDDLNKVIAIRRDA